MKQHAKRWIGAILLSHTLVYPAASSEKTFVDTVATIKQSVVGVGLFSPLSSPRNQLLGTGFVFGDGFHVATNYHVVSEPLDPEIVQHHVVFEGSGAVSEIVKGTIVAIAPAKDIAILKIDKKLTPVVLASDELLPDGTSLAFTGFPIGAVLGLYPATHRGYVAAVTPDFVPQATSQSLSARVLRRVDNSFLVYQLDATAYPGNSGSPVYEIGSGDVFGIINKVFVKETKENVLSKPSGITYAIPVRHLKMLAKENNIAVN
ncbi:S1 family peptidase [Alteromonas oceanisediminis]|uniref:S1 family peptidase n=1 Tax=Alteromonas oceanisediminis TaxID=2836180 RepID=UPI001BDAB247|nr:serine protease [Alteromonas oceanisediminis]MBT0585688.1 S1C family serine protease [Alteromonas oceanisediminis]